MRLRIFRLQDGVRVPWTIELDNELTVLAEYPSATSAAAPPTDPIAHAMAKWAVAEIAENPIPGTDDLRAQYFSEVEALHATYAETGQTCPGCELGDVQRRYRLKLEAAGFIAS